jgi:hypothetical protein
LARYRLPRLLLLLAAPREAIANRPHRHPAHQHRQHLGRIGAGKAGRTGEKEQDAEQSRW